MLDLLWWNTRLSASSSLNLSKLEIFLTHKNNEIISPKYEAPEFHTDHNVYILGAGYSAGAGLPLMANFLEKMRIYRSTLANDNQSAKHIDSVLRFCLDCARSASKVRLDLDNIETILSLAAATEKFEKDGKISTALTVAELVPHAIASTLEYYQKLYRWDNQIHIDNHAYDLYELSALVMAGKLGKLKDQKGQRNTIITFNYDTLVERALMNNGIGFSYGLDTAQVKNKNLTLHRLEKHAEEDDVRILKLHGSINWSAAGIFDSYDELLNYQQNRTSIFKPIILPPWWKKDPSNEISVVWYRAIERLKTATRIIFIGYSCPPTDLYMRYLLGAGLNNNISLTSVYTVNIDQKAHDAIRDLFSTMFMNVRQTKPMSARGFFTGMFPLETGEFREKSYLNEINRDIR